MSASLNARQFLYHIPTRCLVSQDHIQQPVIQLRIWREHHSAPRELAVSDYDQVAADLNLTFFIKPHRHANILIASQRGERGGAEPCPPSDPSRQRIAPSIDGS